MRLKKLKLIGFKSFVDPTTVSFPSSLVAVVGPNGCGKSNIIDAVRWVMGESSAKHLRGESMADVIFNGSRDRKALGQASIELIFENDASRLLGEYASYREISIKRLVTRDGQSNYYLNGTKCRKKDVTDIFLGTGLGPRSYSIIGQGTISRIIEAKPEELRIFLEEAAGISKYKERRRETENRIKHSEENLARVTDLRDELGKQLERLKRQANAAEKFKKLKAEERLYKAQWHALRWVSFTDEITELDKKISEQSLRQEELMTEQNRLEIELEQKRSLYQTDNDLLNTIQADYYRVGAEIARLEETIQHHKQRKQQLEQDLCIAKQDWQSASEHVAASQEKLESLKLEIVQLEPEVSELKSLTSECRAKLEDTEQRKQDWQRQWDSFIHGSAESSKIAHVEQSRIQQLENSIHSLQVRLEKLSNERNQSDTLTHEQDIAQLNQEIEIIEAEHQTHAETAEMIAEQLKGYKLDHSQIEEKFHQERSELEQLKAKEASLLQLQQTALGKENHSEQSWLVDFKLDSAKRLAQLISVDEAYETALEAVLGDKLQSICVDKIDALQQAFSQIDSGTYTFTELDQQLTAAVTTDKPALFQKIKTKHPICQNLLTGIYIAEGLEQALSWLTNIAKHETIVTKDGILIGQGWCRVIREKDEHSGVIAREKAIANIQSQIETFEASCQSLKDNIEQLKENIASQESEKESLRVQQNELYSKLSDKKSKSQVKQNQIQQITARNTAIDEEIEQETEKRESFEQELIIAREAWHNAMRDMEVDAEKREALTQQQDDIKSALDNYRHQLNDHRQTCHEKELALKTRQSEVNNLQTSLQRDSAHLSALSDRIEALTLDNEKIQLDVEDSPQSQLETKLTQHHEAEEKLNHQKHVIEQIKSDLSEMEQQKNAVQDKHRTEQSKIDTLRMDRQTLIVRRQTIEETVQETGQELKPLIENLPSEANEKDWDEHLKMLAIKIQRLGAINLAAIDEYEIESERKNYLDEQFNDLISALDTLVQAIQKIDKETRSRFKETYDQVNEGFQQLFPKLFGGGQAYLELTGEDLLDTGVTVMARPPGKRNSTIHLLSGGEKALTAVALVFSIFQLNPSPFCMLDEVDAPLDDANVARFCSLVKEMTKTVQFIFISHNKVAMEMAEQLLGVTMHEPGVSRIVSVDVEEAIAIAS